MKQETALTKHAKIEYPIICGAMYPCSNPELVAAASEAGGIGIIQPLSLTSVHKYKFLDGLKYIQKLTKKPIGMNIITEKSVERYQKRMEEWLDIALENGVRFFVTSLGNPRWVVDRVKPFQGIVYHDVINKKWAMKALENGVDGIIAVNDRAGGHAGQTSLEDLFHEMKSLNVPLIAAGGISTRPDYEQALALGYSGIQMGTRFIASTECSAHADYKNEIVKSEETDIVLTDKISGVPVSVIKTPTVEKMGIHAGPLTRFLLRHPRTKHYMRMFLMLKSISQLKKASLEGNNYKDYFQAGKSVKGIDSVLPCKEIIHNLISKN